MSSNQKISVCHLFGGVRALKIGKWQSQNGAMVHQVMMQDPAPFIGYWKGCITIHQNKTITAIYELLSSKQFLSVFKAYLFLYIFYIKLIADVVRQNNIAIIHAHRHTGAAMAFISKKLFRLKNVKIIFDYHDPWSAEDLSDKNLIHKIALRFYFYLERYLVNNSDLVITQGEEQTQILLKRYPVPREKFIFTWNTADPLVFKPYKKERVLLRKQYGLEGKVALLYLGSIIRYFGVDLIVKALKNLVKKHPDVVFVSMGVIRDEPYWGEIKKEIAENKLEKYFVEIYPKSKSEIPMLISACDVGLITHMRGSWICEVAIPTKLFEYMSCGLPIVSSDLPHITQFILPYGAGVSFKSNDADSLANVLDKLICDEKSITAMGLNARKAVEGKFNWGVEMQKVMDAYANLF